MAVKCTLPLFEGTPLKNKEGPIYLVGWGGASLTPQSPALPLASQGCGSYPTFQVSWR